jgi:hypothetical protein
MNVVRRFFVLARTWPCQTSSQGDAVIGLNALLNAECFLLVHHPTSLLSTDVL